METTTAMLAVDLGKTRCRLLFTASGASTVVAGDLGIAAPGAPARIADLIERAARDVDTGGVDVTAVTVGAAGVLAAPAAGDELAGELRARFARPVAVASDAVTAHLGAFAGGAGVVLIAGTGATSIGVFDDEVRVVDGAGPEIGDLGSGGWLGRRGATAALRGSQGAGPATALTDLVAAAVPGGTPGLARWSMGAADDSPARRLATLAPIVLQAARDGDTVALGIVDEAIGHLSASASAAVPLQTPRPAPAAVVGGVADDAWFRGRLTAGLAAAGLHPRPARGTALDGAVLAATDPTLPHERWIHRA